MTIRVDRRGPPVIEVLTHAVIAVLTGLCLIALMSVDQVTNVTPLVTVPRSLTILTQKVAMPRAESELVRKQWTDLVEALAPPAGIPEYRAGFEELCARFPIPSGAQVSEVDTGGGPALLITHPDVVDPVRTVVWMHSGGYVFGSARSYRSFGATLSLAAEAQVLMVDYRLAPEHTHPAGLEDATAAYRWLLAQGERPDRIVVGGDSAGGGLALATLLALKDRGDPLPAGGIAVSPVADQTMSAESMTVRAELDPIASREMLAGLCGLYIGDADPAHPYLSPLFGDFSGLPPLLVLVGTDEVLYDDAVRVVERASAAGVDAHLLVGQDQAHIWTLFASVLPEGQHAVDEIGRFVQRVSP
jgi:monoterpene epsilon-lactone hydrolase